MSGYNKCVFVGNLGRDPELRVIPSGKWVCEFSLAINERKDQPPTWIDIVAWEKTAELCHKFLTKGKQVLVEGRLQNETWNDKTTGEKRHRTRIVANQVTFLGAKTEGGQRSESTGQSSSGDGDDLGPPPASDSDIPF